jgi:hypothetical protein
MRKVGGLLGPTDLAGPDAVPPKWNATPYKAVRRAWCTSCLRRYRVRVSKAFRLRLQRSPCCGSRLRAVTTAAQAELWSSGKASGFNLAPRTLEAFGSAASEPATDLG